MLSRSQWPRDLRCRSAATRLLRFCVRIPRGYGCLSFVSAVCCVGSGLCDGLITRPEEFYQLFLARDLEALRVRRPKTRAGLLEPHRQYTNTRKHLRSEDSSYTFLGMQVSAQGLALLENCVA